MGATGCSKYVGFDTSVISKLVFRPVPVLFTTNLDKQLNLSVSPTGPSKTDPSVKNGSVGTGLLPIRIGL